MEMRCVYIKKFTIILGSPVGKQERTGQEQGFILDLSWATYSISIISCTLYVWFYLLIRTTIKISELSGQRLLYRYGTYVGGYIPLQMWDYLENEDYM